MNSKKSKLNPAEKGELLQKLESIADEQIHSVRSNSISTQFEQSSNLIKSKSGFTLIETLIVICIASITLIGILFAKKIIKENDIKSLIVQIKKYDTALHSFTQKYHALPGDIQGTVSYGITESNTDGNGDNVITDRMQKHLQANGEITNFWRHLSKSKMLDEHYDGEEDEKVKIGSTFPASKIGEKVGIVAFGDGGKTFYQIGFEFADTDRIYTNNRSLKTDEASLFDKKTDDGNPQKGQVVAVGENYLNIVKNDDCVKFGDYNQSNPSPACQLRIEAK